MSSQTAMSKERIPTQSTPQSQQQMDLFGSGPSNSALRAPAWLELPAEARAALTSLMTQLILGHVAATASPRAKEVGHDL